MDLRPYYPLLRETSLLRLMRDDELDLLMSCFAPRVRRYQKGELLLLAGYETRETGILLEGQILALKNTPDGASVAITQMGPGGLFWRCAVRFQPAQPGQLHGADRLPGALPAL